MNTRLEIKSAIGQNLKLTNQYNRLMKIFTAIVERDYDTNLYVGYVPGFLGAHSQGETLDKLQENLREVIEMLLEDEEVVFNAQFICS
jgi:predicted RNase H-like HicB family nuclease